VDACCDRSLQRGVLITQRDLMPKLISDCEVVA
jgi:hypothetical protein